MSKRSYEVATERLLKFAQVSRLVHTINVIHLTFAYCIYCIDGTRSPNRSRLTGQRLHSDVTMATHFYVFANGKSALVLC